MSDLVPVHGGLAEPVDCTVSAPDAREGLAREARELTSIRVTKWEASMLHRIADGTLSPLTGPMRAAEYERVLEECALLSQGKRYAWTIPLALPVTADAAAALQGKRAAALHSEDGELIGVLADIEVYPRDAAKFLQRVYGTARSDHPGARLFTRGAEYTHALGGTLRALAQPRHPQYGAHMRTPREMRAQIREHKWQRALAFQTRNPLHRAHEYALVAGVERLTAAGFRTGVVLSPLVGELKAGDTSAEMRMRCYLALKELRLLGEGDKDEALWQRAGYDIGDVFDVSGIDMGMFYAGPAEAVMHAIYRQNHGFSDIVIGRKHADAPFDDGTPIWGDFDAQKIFETLAGELHIRPCNIGFAAYYESAGRVDLMERHPNEKPYSISGTKLREQLRSGERPDPRILRPQIADILIADEARRAG